MDTDTKILYTKKGQAILIDTADYLYLSRFTWYIDSKGYARSSMKIDGVKKIIKMHRIIMGLNDPQQQVDHINRIKTDNRSVNLRICTNAENSINRGKHKNTLVKYKGVRLHNINRNKKYQSRIRIHGKNFSLGYYEKSEIAARVYDICALINYGNTIYINNINLQHV